MIILQDWAYCPVLEIIPFLKFAPSTEKCLVEPFYVGRHQSC